MVGMLGTVVTLPTMLAIAALIAVTVAFMALMRAPTMQGRRALDAIEGYRMYLSVAESGRLDMAAREPAMTVERFEAHLPYAMALGVADAWTEKFARRVDLGKPGAAGDAHGYRPRWYRTTSGFSSPSDLAGHLSGTLGHTIAAAATAPGSASSGSGGFSSGGGSSGGGGGGGGGGSW
jgi:uncharacterized membrane protein